MTDVVAPTVDIMTAVAKQVIFVPPSELTTEVDVLTPQWIQGRAIGFQARVAGTSSINASQPGQLQLWE